MRKKLLALWGIPALAVLLVPLASAQKPATPKTAAGTTQIITVDQVQRGMKGFGLTVFSGFKIERFKVEVIDILQNFLPKQDLLLVRIDHPVLRKATVVGGMSGSPVYLEGKLAGALAYGWTFSKEPIAGITPISNMLDLLKRPTRGPDHAGYASVFGAKGLNRLARSTHARPDRWWNRPFSPPPRQPDTMLRPVALPLNAAGFSAEAMALLKDAFSSYGFEPVQGGGTGQAQGPTSYQEGGAIGVQLVSGDMTLTSTGTITWTDGKNVLAFGHRMFNAGEIYIPTVTARINHTLTRVNRSYKLSTPARQIGTLVQDRQAGIMVDMSRRIETIPMTVTLHFQGRKSSFNARLARHRLLTPNLASSVLSSAISEAIPDVAHATIRVSSRLSVRGFPQVVFDDYIYSPSGGRMAAVLFSHGLQALQDVMNNDFEPANVERVDIDVDIKFARDVLEITEISASSTTVDPGSRINLAVTFRPYGGAEFTRFYPLEIPAGLAGSLLQAEVASGSQVKPDKAPPENLGQFLENIQLRFPARALVISLMMPTQGVKLRGKVIHDLPSSVIDALNTGTQIRAGSIFNTISRQVHGTRRIILGKKQIRIRVRSEVAQ